MDLLFQDFIIFAGLRFTGPMHLRLIIQPLMALLFAVRDGIRDARAGRRLYIAAFIREPANRTKYLKDGWRSVGKVFILAVILDMVFQVAFMAQLNVIGSLVTGFILALLPYLLLRGPANYIAGLIMHRNKKGADEASG